MTPTNDPTLERLRRTLQAGTPPEVVVDALVSNGLSVRQAERLVLEWSGRRSSVVWLGIASGLAGVACLVVGVFGLVATTDGLGQFGPGTSGAVKVAALGATLVLGGGAAVVRALR
ncbi:MAG: hypothetical protein ABMB14_22310 [Myxococcota bacterium]